MLNWIFRRNAPGATDKQRPARPTQAPAATPERADKPPAASPAPAPAVDWQLRLQHALGSESALLALLREPAPVGVKLAAIGGLTSEASLKQAERDSRHQDRRVHRLAKQRHQALVARRETAAQAGMLIDSARALLDAPLIAANRLVELDRAWQALDASLVEAAQRDEFRDVQGRLATLARERGDLLLRVERWSVEGRDALDRLQAATAGAAAGTAERAQLAQACAAALVALEAAPAEEGCAAARIALRRALDLGTQLDERLVVLDELLRAPAIAPPARERPVQPAGATAAAAPKAGAADADVTAGDEGVEPVPAAESAADAVAGDAEAALVDPGARDDAAASLGSGHAQPAFAPQADAARADATAAEVMGAEPTAIEATPTAGTATEPAAIEATPTDATATGATATLAATPAEATASEATLADAPSTPSITGEAGPDQALSGAPIAPPGLSSPSTAGEPGPAGAVAAEAFSAPPPSAEPAGPEPAPVADPLARWKALPPLDDPQLAATLERRVQQALRAREAAAAAARPARRERERERERPAPEAAAPPRARPDRSAALAAALEQAEAALAGGHLADTHQRLTEVEALLEGGTPAGALRGRIDGLQAEYARLKGWQRWSGGLARDELVAQAEALAAGVHAEPGVAAPRAPVRQQAERIEQLRARWKELDRAGGPSSRTLWERFDAALKTAYEPVAAHLDLQRAAREKNLESRTALLKQLDEVALPAADAGVEPDWKSIGSALHQFHTEWRKLGPVEHTVPHKPRDALLARMKASVARLEAPLEAARREAQRVREQLVERAEALAAEAAALGREAIPRVRELQAQWQQHARSLPLARGVENALWTRFKHHVDAVYGARDAAQQARDAEFRAHAAERLRLIERIEALAPDTPAGEVKRTLAEIDGQWWQAGPAPRADAAALETRYRNAREAAGRALADVAQRRWQAACDTLETALARCEAAESDPAQLDDARAGLAPGAPDAPALLPAWRQALERHLDAAAAPPASAPPVGQLLLQLESAFQVESPPAFQGARRDMKLQAMKAALEGRGSAPVPPRPAVLVADALSRRGLDAEQRERLRRVLAALRRRGPAEAS